MVSEKLILLMNIFEILNQILLLVVCFNVSPTFVKFKNKIMGQLDNNPSQEAFNMILKALTNKYASDALIVIDVNGKVLLWNKGAELMFGRTSLEMCQNNLSPIMETEDFMRHMENLSIYRQTGISRVAGTQIHINAIRRDGTKFPIQLSIFLDKTLDEDIDVFVGIIKDESEKNRLRIEALENVIKMEEYESIAKIGGWTWNLTTDNVAVTQGFCDIFELDCNDDISSKILMQRVHIDDRHNTNNIILDAFEKKSNYNVDYRIKRMNDEVVMVHCRAKAILDKNGSLVQYVGTIQQK